MSHRHPLLEMEPLYGFCHAGLRWAYATTFRGDIAGLENLPSRGGYLVAANHASFLDAPIVGAHLPQQVAFFARKSLWKPGFASWWLNRVGTIPVDRDGVADIAAIRRVLQTLAAGRTIILFPEGTRTPDGKLQTPKPGIGLIACRTGAPVVPARVFGSFDAFGRDRKMRLGTSIQVTFGRPLLPAEYDHPADGRERYQRAAERIMAAVSALAPLPAPAI